MEKVLITGGAGFIGSHLAKNLISNGCFVRILDPLTQQVHGSVPGGLDWLNGNQIEFIRDSVNNIEVLKDSLDGIDTVVHLAAETGTGQSMYETTRYFGANVQGTATLIDALQNTKKFSSVKSVVVASSRAVYGEGAYLCPSHGLVFPSSRANESLAQGDFELYCPDCGHVLQVTDTFESSPFQPVSIYGLTKQVQEQLVLMYARTHGINGIALRYQNVFGPGQSLKNPYTGILAVFSNLARQGQPIDVYEDGNESRDFVYIEDVVNATVRAVRYPGSYVGALNVGTGHSVSVISVAQEINEYFGNQSEIKVSGSFRYGDIRHNKAGTENLKSILNYQPCVSFRDGLHRFLAWAEMQPLEDKTAYQKSVSELRERGLMGGGR